MDWQRIDPDCSEDALTALREVASQHAITIVDLQTLLTALFPDADSNGILMRYRVRHVRLFLFHRREQQTFGQTPLVRLCDDGAYRLTDEFRSMLEQTTFRTFFTDTVEAGLFNALALAESSRKHHIRQNHGFLYGEKYSVFDVMRLCGWPAEQVRRMSADTNWTPKPAHSRFSLNMRRASMCFV